MKNLNDPRMPNQEKQYELQKVSDPSLVKRQKEEAKKGNRISFPSYWVVKVSDLIQFAGGAEKTDTIFQLETPVLKTLHPDCSVLLFETDRREAGEWDNFYRRIAPYSYQGVFCVLINGEFDYMNSEGIAYHLYEKTHPEVSDYPRTLKYLEKGQDLIMLGVLEIPLEQLTPYEESRVYERTWDFSKFYEEALGRVARDLLTSADKNPHWSVTPKTTRIRRKKGFGS